MGASVLVGIGQVLDLVCNILQIVIIMSVVISWLSAPESNQIVQMVRAVTEPIYRPLRRFTRKLPGPIDWAPMILWLILVSVQTIVVRHMLMRAAM